MKKLIYSSIIAVTVLLTGCNNFLDTESLTKKNTSNYPQTVADAQQVLAGIYNNLDLPNANASSSFLMVATLASDDQLGGGGENDKQWQAEDMMLNTGTDMMGQFWSDRYVGINRANVAIETLGNCKGYASTDQQNQMLGEAYFLRAFYFYELASLFENIPLPIVSSTKDFPQAAPAKTWGQIISDLKMAISLMPAKKFGSSWVDAGHVDKWAAEALMGRAFLFYTGFYNATDVTLPDNSKVTKADVIGWIDDCVNNSGYSLVGDFRNLWAYTNRCTLKNYTYPGGNAGLKWVEDDNGVNSESMFAIKFNKFANWGTSIEFSNGYALCAGLRGAQDYNKTFPFGQGWGAGPVAPNLWKDWVTAEPNDGRRVASVAYIPTELPNYAKGQWDFVQETDYYAKKWSPVVSKKADGTCYDTFEQDMYSYTTVNFQLSNIHDLVLIRFADVLLMQSELKQDVAGINKVRIRAGLPTIGTYSDAALRNERRWELVGEGTRWNDIRRWHIAETALAAQAGQPTYYKGIADVNTTASNGGGYAVRYKATNGFFPIPESQIALSNGVLKQNAGWGTKEAEYTGWK